MRIRAKQKTYADDRIWKVGEVREVPDDFVLNPNVFDVLGPDKSKTGKRTKKSEAACDTELD